MFLSAASSTSLITCPDLFEPSEKIRTKTPHSIDRVDQGLGVERGRGHIPRGDPAPDLARLEIGAHRIGRRLVVARIADKDMLAHLLTLPIHPRLDLRCRSRRLPAPVGALGQVGEARQDRRRVGELDQVAGGQVGLVLLLHDRLAGKGEEADLVAGAVVAALDVGQAQDQPVHVDRGAGDPADGTAPCG